MALIVQKYGGTSVADPDHIRAVAEHVAFTKRHGNDVVLVVSAMGKTTDNLIKLANDVSITGDIALVTGAGNLTIDGATHALTGTTNQRGLDIDLGTGEMRDAFLAFRLEEGRWVLDDLYSEDYSDGLKAMLRQTIAEDEALGKGGQ